MEPSDAEIVHRVLRGERGGLALLVERHGAALWGALRARETDPEEARELFQETWARALERLGALREPERLRAWLVSIALNLARDRGRRARRAPPETALDAREPVDPAAGGWERLADDELAARAREELDRLPERQREVLVLRLGRELSHAEIAAALGITEEASRASAYQGLRRLRARLGGRDD